MGDAVIPDASPGDTEPDHLGHGARQDRHAEIAASVELLAQVALQQDDPVAALEEGAEVLAQMLAERDLAAQERHWAEEAARDRQEVLQVEFQQAYRHARLHRVGELVDLGYSLDQAVVVTNANEADIRQRALAAGRDPAEVILRYAVLHGYRPQRSAPPARPEAGRRSAMATGGARDLAERRPTTLESLAAMSDSDFAKATSGDKWQRLLRG
jgi:hypothetical protein